MGGVSGGGFCLKRGFSWCSFLVFNRWVKV